MDGLEKAFPDGTRALRGIHLRLHRRQLTTLLGPSGCGKSTLLRLVAGLELPSAGRLWLDELDMTTLGPAQRPVSMVFQNYALFPHLSVWDNVLFGLRASGMAPKEQAARAQQALDMVGMGSMARRFSTELSGGQQQRVALARALALQPKVLLLDEPLSNLDVALRRQIREDIRELQRSHGLTVLYVTHDQEEAMAVSDQIALMHEGRILQVGTPRDIYETPASETVASMMGDAAIFDAHTGADGHLWLGPLDLGPHPGTRHGPLRLVVRPQAWRMEAACGEGLAGKVVSRAYVGRQTEYQVSTTLGMLFILRSGERTGWRSGSPVSLFLHARDVSVLPPSNSSMPAGP